MSTYNLLLYLLEHQNNKVCGKWIDKVALDTTGKIPTERFNCTGKGIPQPLPTMSRQSMRGGPTNWSDDGCTNLLCSDTGGGIHMSCTEPHPWVRVTFVFLTLTGRWIFSTGQRDGDTGASLLVVTIGACMIQSAYYYRPCLVLSNDGLLQAFFWKGISWAGGSYPWWQFPLMVASILIVDGWRTYLCDIFSGKFQN